MLKGRKVMLRPVKRSDLPYFLKWFNDPEVIQYLGAYLPMTEIAEEKFIEELGTTKAQTDVLLIIEAIDGSTGTPIGTIGLHRINGKDRNAIFGISIGEREYWSKGYGTEATRLIVNYGFQQLNLHRITSSVWAFNTRSIALHKKVGFKEEGTIRQFVFKNGQYHDRIDFGMLESEWDKA
jgi:RimJ/RimL family protein N-acetyltransferase